MARDATIEHGGCIVGIDPQVAMMFIDCTMRSHINEQRMPLSMLSNLRSAWRVIACAHIVDCTEDEELRIARGHVVVDGEECTIHTHGVFLPGRLYSVHAQLIFRTG